MTQTLFDLSGKTALVTGGTHGLGMAIATGLARAGATIIINDVFAGKLETAKEEYAKIGIQIHAYILDVCDEDAVERTIPLMEKEAGPIEILVNNAGIIKRIPILEMKAEEFRQVLDVDLTGPFIMSKAVAKGMVERGGGKIINMCSMMSVYGRNSVSAYASAKGGLKLLTANMCCEWAKHNIQVNGIGPGYIATAQTAPIREGGHPFNDLVMMRTPAGRWGEPEDIGNAALFLSSKAADFVNGHILYVDGGILANFGYVKGENDV